MDKEQEKSEDIQPEKLSNIINFNDKVLEKKQQKQSDARIRAINNILEYAQTLDW